MSFGDITGGLFEPEEGTVFAGFALEDLVLRHPRERIRKAVHDHFIAVGALPSRVFRSLSDALSEGTDFPCIVIMTGEDRVQLLQAGPRVYRHDLDVMIVAIDQGPQVGMPGLGIKPLDERVDVITRFAEIAMMSADETWGGLAVDTTLGDTEPWDIEFEGELPVGVVVQHWSIEYHADDVRNELADLYSLHVELETHDSPDGEAPVPESHDDVVLPSAPDDYEVTHA